MFLSGVFGAWQKCTSVATATLEDARPRASKLAEDVASCEHQHDSRIFIECEWRGRKPVVLTQVQALDRISIEVTNRCAKACWFCYECRPALSEIPG